MAEILQNLVLRVILAFKRRLYKKLHRRNPNQRLKARQYYRTHKNKILLQRRRYQHKTSPFKKTKKFFKRAVPSWLHHSKKPGHTTRKGPLKSPSYKPKKLKQVLKRPPKRRKTHDENE